MSNHITITGRLADDIELRSTPQGKSVANGRVADTPRRLNQQTNAWEDAGETLWLSFSIWDAKAEALVGAAHKGDLVTVTGELTARSWDAQDGTKRTVNEIKAREVAVVPRGQRQHPAQQSQGGPRQQADPWSQPQQQGGWGGQQATAAAHDEPSF